MKQKIIKEITQRILDEQRKHPTLNWAKIAAQKIYSSYKIERIMVLEYYGGNGFDTCEENGYFEIRYEEKTATFYNLKKARKFYDSLNETKFFWDLTTIPELIDGYNLVEKPIN